jgi:hypothetical protein
LPDFDACCINTEKHLGGGGLLLALLLARQAVRQRRCRWLLPRPSLALRPRGMCDTGAAVRRRRPKNVEALLTRQW